MCTEDPSAELEPPRGRWIGWHLLAVALVASGLLAFYAETFEPHEHHLHHPFADQAGYITTARTWTDTGQLRSGIIYPAYVLTENWRPYMPGHYAALSAAYRLFGYSPFTTLLPSLVSYVLAALGVFAAASKRYGRQRGWVGVSLFFLFSPLLAYSFTAMAELTLIAAASLALAAFTCLPLRAQRLTLPLLLCLPFVFRETGALYILPMISILIGKGEGSLKRLTGIVLASVVILSLVHQGQVAQGKGSLPLSWVSQNGFNYTDALSEPTPLPWAEWPAAVWGNLERNLHQYVNEDVRRHTPDENGITGLLLLLATGLVGLGAGLVRLRRDPALFGGALLFWSVVLLIYLLYDVRGQKAMRSLLFTTPALAVALAGVPLGRPGRAPRFRWALAPVVLLAAWGSHRFTGALAEQITQAPDSVAECDALMESVGHDDSTLLMAPGDMMARYAVHHYPVAAAFPPANEGTLALLEQRWPVGTLILSRRMVGWKLKQEKFHLDTLPPYRKGVSCEGNLYSVYQRR